jgi:hypothetical protein
MSIRHVADDYGSALAMILAGSGVRDTKNRNIVLLNQDYLAVGGGDYSVRRRHNKVNACMVFINVIE